MNILAFADAVSLFEKRCLEHKNAVRSCHYRLSDAMGVGQDAVLAYYFSPTGKRCSKLVWTENGEEKSKKVSRKIANALEDCDYPSSF